MPTHDVLSCYQLFGFNISDIYKYRAAELDRFISVRFHLFAGLVSSDFSTVFHEECVVLPGVCALTSPTSLGITIAFPLFFMYTDVSPSFTMAYCNVYSLRCVKIMIITSIYITYILQNVGYCPLIQTMKRWICILCLNYFFFIDPLQFV